MDCALSLTGERRIIASAIFLVRQFINDSGDLTTILENIDDIYLQIRNVLSAFDDTSDQVVSASAIAGYVTTLLEDYRRKDVDILMAEIKDFH